LRHFLARFFDFFGGNENKHQEEEKAKFIDKKLGCEKAGSFCHCSTGSNKDLTSEKIFNEKKSFEFFFTRRCRRRRRNFFLKI
jgi:hypothetical protein